MAGGTKGKSATKPAAKPKSAAAAKPAARPAAKTYVRGGAKVTQPSQHGANPEDAAPAGKKPAAAKAAPKTVKTVDQPSVNTVAKVAQKSAFASGKAAPKSTSASAEGSLKPSAKRKGETVAPVAKAAPAAVGGVAAKATVTPKATTVPKPAASPKAADPGPAPQPAAPPITAPVRTEGPGYALYRYPDYASYVAIQTAGNKAKLKRQLVKRSHIDRLAAWLQARGRPVRAGLCHGTRSGREQRWFRRELSSNGILGTEISETATDMPFTERWDFHDVKPEWSGRFDFVYSNSWCHAFEPERAFTTWIGQLRPGGVLLLDHLAGHVAQSASELGPFGVDLPALQDMLVRIGRAEGAALRETFDWRDNKEYPARVLVVEKL